MTNENKHTPAPWYYEEECAYGFSIYSVVRNEVWVASAHNDHGDPLSFPSKEEKLANAQLITASPDMLREMKSLAKALEDVADIPESYFAAIRKAEGK